MYERILSCILLGLLAMSAAAAENAPPERAPDTVAARVMACAACHGAQGQGTDNDYFPRLGGKPAGYLYNQLLAFRDGRRQYPPMNYLLAYLPDAYLQKIADYFASQKPPYQPAVPADVTAAQLKRGEQLARHGDPSKHVPACAACHGASLAGMEPAIPGLLGLHANYLSAQLGAWRYGTRTAKAPDCMHTVASRLPDEDITAVAAWLASTAPPADTAPLAAGSLQLPLTCGSESR